MHAVEWSWQYLSWTQTYLFFPADMHVRSVLTLNKKFLWRRQHIRRSELYTSIHQITQQHTATHTHTLTHSHTHASHSHMTLTLTLSTSKHNVCIYCIVLHCIALCCIVLHCIALYCIVLHCIALHCIALCRTYEGWRRVVVLLLGVHPHRPASHLLCACSREE